MRSVRSAVWGPFTPSWPVGGLAIVFGEPPAAGPRFSGPGPLMAFSTPGHANLTWVF